MGMQTHSVQQYQYVQGKENRLHICEIVNTIYY